MPLRVPKFEEQVSEAIGRLRATGDEVGWLRELVELIADDLGVDAEITTNIDADRQRWSLEVAARGQAVALIDVINVGPGVPTDAGYSDIDLLVAKAFRCWQRVTRHGEIGDVRPWIGVVVVQSGGAEQLDEEIDQLVRSRMIDSAARLVLRTDGGEVEGEVMRFGCLRKRARWAIRLREGSPTNCLTPSELCDRGDSY